MGPAYPSLLGPSVDPTQLAPQASTLDQTNAQNVPTFSPPPNPAVPIHHGLLSRIGTALNGGISPVPSGMEGLLSQGDLNRARSAGWFALGNSLLNPQLDARGFKQSTLGSIASGLQGAQQASNQSIGGALQAGQYATGIADKRRLDQGRQMAAQQFAIQPSDTPAQQLTKLSMHSQFLTSIGDDVGAKAIDAAAAAMNHARGIYAPGGAAGAPVDKWQLRDLGNRYVQYDPITHQMMELDGTPVKNAAISEKPGAAENRAQRAASSGVANDQKVIGHFMTDTADLRKENAAYNSFATIAHQAGAGNPEAYKSAIINYMGALDPKAQVRSKMLEFASKVDPSVKGQFDTFVARVKNGTFPANQLAGMLAVADASHQSYVQQYQAKRNDYSKRNPSAAPLLPGTDAEFATPGIPTAGAPAAPAAKGPRKPLADIFK